MAAWKANSALTMVRMCPDDPSVTLRTGLGSASLIQDSTGRWLADHRFYPYGETRRSDGASESYPTDKLFTGMLKKQRLGIYRMGARWYDPYLNRWLSPDTIVPAPANPQDLNRYSFVRANPCRYVDPYGHSCKEPYDDDEAYQCTDTEEEVLDATVKIYAIIYVPSVLEDGTTILTPIESSFLATAVAPEILISHDHSDTLNNPNKQVLVFRVTDRKGELLWEHGTMTLAHIGGETSVITLEGMNASSWIGTGSPEKVAIGSEVAQAYLDGSAGELSVLWTERVAPEGFTPNKGRWVVADSDNVIGGGDSGGGVYYGGLHVANHYGGYYGWSFSSPNPDGLNFE